jgi:SOS response regulatory protein OraA/RecX
MSSSKRRHDASRTVTRLARYARAGVRSRQQVLAHLRRSGVSPREALRLVHACEARGVVDDEAAARLWADHWARRGYAWAAIRAKLEARGFGARAIEAAAARSGLAAEDELRARQLLAEHLRRGRGDRARLARTLASRGFDPDLIDRLLDEAAGHPVSA